MRKPFKLLILSVLLALLCFACGHGDDKDIPDEAAYHLFYAEQGILESTTEDSYHLHLENLYGTRYYADSKREGEFPIGDFFEQAWTARFHSGHPVAAALKLREDGTVSGIEIFVLTNPQYDATAGTISFDAEELASEGDAPVVDVPFGPHLLLMSSKEESDVTGKQSRKSDLDDIQIARILERIKQLQAEANAGEEQMTALNIRLTQLNETMTRIQGAIQVLTDVMAELNNGPLYERAAERLRSLQRELDAGLEHQRVLEGRKNDLSQTMLRIRGAIEVLKETLSEILHEQVNSLAAIGENLGSSSH